MTRSDGLCPNCGNLGFTVKDPGGCLVVFVMFGGAAVLIALGTWLSGGALLHWMAGGTIYWHGVLAAGAAMLLPVLLVRVLGKGKLTRPYMKCVSCGYIPGGPPRKL